MKRKNYNLLFLNNHFKMFEIKSLMDSIINDIELANSFGMTVNEMYNMFDEINNIELDESNGYCYCDSYDDEGFEESFY